MTGDEIRKSFVEFFSNHGHTQVVSSSLIPQNDPTLMFTNAGMTQFKSVFLGEERPPYVRAVSSQKCVRAGGKHNDLENVGRTARHHTFFEMLGNFSFGDYFKEEAIPLAWEFVTQHLHLPVEKLLVTVYSQDDEAFRIWQEKVGLPAEKIIRIATSDNFWSMGETGPCGPCSEIFYDHGPGLAGGPPGSPESEGDRFVEIWNLVFMQYNRDANGTLTPLPSPCIDTGAGLERLATILQGKTNNYDSDLFQPLIQATAQMAGKIYGADAIEDISLRVIADHLRSVGFLVADGVLPSNEGRGYVLRRIMRRAMRHGRKLGMEKPFLHHLVPVLVTRMGGVFPELIHQAKTMAMVIENEEKRFSVTLGSGMKHLENALLPLAVGEELDGDTVFTLYDTFGFPVDLTADVARDRGVTLAMARFETLMDEQRTRARAAWAGSGDQKVGGVFYQLRQNHGASEFLGYHAEVASGAIVALVVQGQSVPEVHAGQECSIVVNQSPFYAESGGQVGDEGIIFSGENRFKVLDTRKPVADLIVHQGRMEAGVLTVGQPVTLEVDHKRRLATRAHHSATHLLHHALTLLLGTHVKQAGSMVGPERLRFDFSHFQALTVEELEAVEERVNAAILANALQETVVMTPQEAVKAGAMALFGEKYGDEVRVVRIGESLELCGGTHVVRSGDIGLFRIVSESAVAAGVRRLEAVCGEVARLGLREEVRLLKKIAELIRVPAGQTVQGVQKILARQKELEQELEKMKHAAAGDLVKTLMAQVQTIHDIPVLIAKVSDVDVKGLRELLDRLRDKMGSGVIVLAVVDSGKVTLIAGVTEAWQKQIRAGDLIRYLASLVGGKGGGRPDMAQGGGDAPDKLPDALAKIPQWIAQSVV
ncbi:MAG: alanine--tRNA ligase [Magnetococcus sp. DMHC-6]